MKETSPGKNWVLDASTWGSLRVELRVIHAMLMREIMTRFGRHNIGFMWLFVEPMLFTLFIATLWGMMRGSESYGISIYAFALTGYATVMLWRNMPSRCIGAVQANSVLFYHRNVRVMDVYVARLLLEATGATIGFLMLSIIFILLGLAPVPENTMLVIIGWLMTAWFGASLGLFIGTLSEFSEVVEKIWAPFSYIMFPLSGAMFMVAALPPKAQDVILLLPMVHGVECIREGFFGSTVETRFDLTYMAVFNLVLLLFGLAQMQLVGKRAIVQ